MCRFVPLWSRLNPLIQRILLTRPLLPTQLTPLLQQIPPIRLGRQTRPPRQTPLTRLTQPTQPNPNSRASLLGKQKAHRPGTAAIWRCGSPDAGFPAAACWNAVLQAEKGGGREIRLRDKTKPAKAPAGGLRAKTTARPGAAGIFFKKGISLLSFGMHQRISDSV